MGEHPEEKMLALAVALIGMIILTLGLLVWTAVNTDPSKKIRVESISCGQYGTVQRIESPNTGKVFYKKLWRIVNCPSAENDSNPGAHKELPAFYFLQFYSRYLQRTIACCKYFSCKSLVGQIGFTRDLCRPKCRSALSAIYVKL